MNKKLIYFLPTAFFIFINNVKADVPTIGNTFKYEHPEEAALYSYLSLIVLLSLILTLSLIILGKIKRNKENQNNTSTKNNPQENV